ncbi:MAG: hypothetical protein IT451_11785 [Candidatus Brocadia sp.]|nr:hypothetical protein [Candidatus Brocadia sp.]
MNRLFEFLEENNGGISFMRVASLGIIGVTLFVWAYTSIKTMQIQKIDIEQLMLMLGALGFKLGQKIIENKTSPEGK